MIETVFRARASAGRHVIQGIGDDAAIVEIPPGHQLVISTDTLVEGVHFFAGTDPFDIGHKSLAVNLSDIAAMGADPLWMTLAMTLPDNDLVWLQRYADGLFCLANRYSTALIGGNLSLGPRTITITIFGSVPAGHALLRSGACIDDDIYLTGEPGMAALALSILTAEIVQTGPIPQACLERLLRPEPRVSIGQAIRPYASACIDISDGLAGDLRHLLIASGSGARIDLASIPLCEPLQALPPSQAWDHALCRGDDYELCFTAAPMHRQLIARIANDSSCKITRIGRIIHGSGVRWMNADDSEMPLTHKAYQHF